MIFCIMIIISNLVQFTIGLTGMPVAVTGSQFGPGMSTQSVVLGDLNCLISDTSLANCPEDLAGSPANCLTHVRDAGVACIPLGKSIK